MKNPITIGNIKEKRPNGRSPTHYSYKDVKSNLEGWANPEEFLPRSFDLCSIKTEKDKVLKGWHTGQEWDGLKLEPNHNIKFWKIDKSDGPVE